MAFPRVLLRLLGLLVPTQGELKIELRCRLRSALQVLKFVVAQGRRSSRKPPQRPEPPAAMWREQVRWWQLSPPPERRRPEPPKGQMQVPRWAPELACPQRKPQQMLRPEQAPQELLSGQQAAPRLLVLRRRVRPSQVLQRPGLQSAARPG